MKKILVLSSQAFSLYQFRMDMMKSFIGKGYQVIAAAPDYDENIKKKISEHGIMCKEFYMERTGVNPINDIKGYISLIKLLKEIKPDKIFTYQAKTVIYGALAAKNVGIKEIYALVAGLGSVFRSEKNSFTSHFVKQILSLEYRVALRNSKIVFFQNHDDSKVFMNRRLVDSQKIKYLNGSGVNLQHFQKAKMPEKKIFLFVGRLIKDKGIIEYLNAARSVKAKHPGVVFNIIGYYDTNPSAVQPEYVEEFIKDGSVNYLGKKDDVYPWLKECYAFVLPSYHEGMPKSVLEAMAVGRAVITSDSPGCRETVIDGNNGYLIPVGDSKLLAERMTYLIENEEVTRQMAERSYELALQKYDVDKVDNEIMNLMGM